MKTKVLIIGLILSFGIMIGCNSHSTSVKTSENNNETIGVFVDMKSMDGCQWIIKLEDGTKLQPVNLQKFDIKPADGMKIGFTYKKSDMATVCMMGQSIEILSIHKK